MLTEKGALEEENKSLVERLRSVRAESRAERETEMARQKAVAAADRDRLERQLQAAMEGQAVAEQACLRAKREAASAAADARAAREAALSQFGGQALAAATGTAAAVAAGAPVADAEGAAAAASALSPLQLVAQLENAERARQESEERAASEQRSAERAASEARVTQAALAADVSRIEAHSKRLQADTDMLRDRVERERVRREEAEAGQRSAERRAAEAGAMAAREIDRLSSESDRKTRALASRLEQAVSLYNQSAAEAENVLAEKEDALDTWKKEAKEAAARLERVGESQRLEIERLTHRNEELSNKLQTLVKEASSDREGVERWRLEEATLRPELEAAVTARDDLQRRLAAISAREDGMLRERRELAAAVDAAKVESARACRQRDAALAQAEQLRREADETERAKRDTVEAVQRERALQALVGSIGGTAVLKDTNGSKASKRAQAKVAAN